MGEPQIPAGFVYHFPALIDYWHDGDTPVVHRGSKPREVIHGERIRVEGINAPELSQAGGPEARDYASTIAPPGTLVTLVASRSEKYGRFFCRVVLPDGSDFGDRMVAAGHAAPYLGA